MDYTVSIPFIYIVKTGTGSVLDEGEKWFMLSIILSWIIIGLYACLYGKVCIGILYKGKEKNLYSIDIFIACGIMVLNVYAQFFSIFYKVSAAAFFILTLGAAGCSYYIVKVESKRSYKDYATDCICSAWKKIKRHKSGLVLCMLIMCGTILWTNLVPQHYDTYLYHAQAVHWIEDFGVIPGLGNLHFRLAYNSAFMGLQALFSFAWLSGRSLHTVNGFVAVLMLVYVVLTIHRSSENRMDVSDMLKVSVLFYLIYSTFNISSPNTDTWALLLISYICIKWSEFVEEEERSALPYSFLCLLSVYAMTLKLSAATFVILALYPAAILILSRNWKQIAIHVFSGFLIILPWFVRNVIISGYLVYPYWECDFFQFDWKMPKEALIEDRKEIIAWGRGHMDTERCGESLMRWVPEWYMSIHPLWRILFVIAVIAGFFLIYYVMKSILRRRSAGRSVLIVVVLAGMFSWFFSAPLPRYGIIYMMFLPCILVGILFGREIDLGICINKLLGMISGKIGYIVITMILLYGLLYFPYSSIVKCGRQPILWQSDYANKAVDLYSLEEYCIAVPRAGDQTGYEPFPAVPYPHTLASIELRGRSLESGFRKK